jgi:predicted HTH domain antitoxin
MSNVILEIPAEFARSFGSTEAEAVRNAKIELAIEMYREGKWSTRHAAEFAELNRWEFMEILRARRIPVPYTHAMLEQDIAHARSCL